MQNALSTVQITDADIETELQEPNYSDLNQAN